MTCHSDLATFAEVTAFKEFEEATVVGKGNGALSAIFDERANHSDSEEAAFSSCQRSWNR